MRSQGIMTWNKAGLFSRRSCFAGLAACLCLSLAVRALADVLTVAQVAQISYNAGFRGDGLVNAIAVAFAESSFNPNAVNTNTNGSVDRGLWQINDKAHPNVNATCAFAPVCAANAVYVITNSGTNWNAWYSSLNGPAYNSYLPTARTAAADVSGSGIDLYVDGNYSGPNTTPNGEPSTPYNSLSAALNTADTTHAFTIHIVPFWYKEKIGTGKHVHFVTNGSGTVRIGG